jgi:hypothetical protein
MTRNLTKGAVYTFHLAEYFKYADPFLASVVPLRVVDETETGVWTVPPEEPGNEGRYFFPWASIVMVARE